VGRKQKIISDRIEAADSRDYFPSTKCLKPLLLLMMCSTSLDDSRIQQINGAGRGRQLWSAG